MSNLDVLLESDAKAADYRLMFVGAFGEVINVERLNATSDEVAQTVAEQSASTHAVELWQGLRFIERFQPNLPEPEKRTADHPPPMAVE